MITITDVNPYEVWLRCQEGYIEAFDELFEKNKNDRTNRKYRNQILNKMLDNAKKRYNKDHKNPDGAWKKYFEAYVPPEEVESLFDEVLFMLMERGRSVAGDVNVAEITDAQSFFKQLKYLFVHMVNERYKGQITTISILYKESSENKDGVITSVYQCDKQAYKDFMLASDDNLDFENPAPAYLKGLRPEPNCGYQFPYTDILTDIIAENFFDSQHFTDKQREIIQLLKNLVYNDNSEILDAFFYYGIEEDSNQGKTRFYPYYRLNQDKVAEVLGYADASGLNNMLSRIVDRIIIKLFYGFYQFNTEQGSNFKSLHLLKEGNRIHKQYTEKTFFLESVAANIWVNIRPYLFGDESIDLSSLDLFRKNIKEKNGWIKDIVDDYCWVENEFDIILWDLFYKAARGEKVIVSKSMASSVLGRVASAIHQYLYDMDQFIREHERFFNKIWYKYEDYRSFDTFNQRLKEEIHTPVPKILRPYAEGEDKNIIYLTKYWEITDNTLFLYEWVADRGWRNPLPHKFNRKAQEHQVEKHPLGENFELKVNNRSSFYLISHTNKKIFHLDISNRVISSIGNNQEIIISPEKNKEKI